MLLALNNQIPDVLPVTTHHILKSYLDKRQGGMSNQAFFDKFGFDSVNWFDSLLAGNQNEYMYQPDGQYFTAMPKVVSDEWQVEAQDIDHDKYETVRFHINTPKGSLEMMMQSTVETSWILEYPLKEKKDIDLLAAYLPQPTADLEGVRNAAAEIGEKGITRSFVPCTIDMHGQPGCWQDACCLFGTERMIMETYDDPAWVHALLEIIQKRKLRYIESLDGAAYDLIELGGGDGCTSVISPGIFDEFVAPYDKALIDAAHAAGQRVTYHLCGSYMPLLDALGAMGMDALETLTPVAMGGDANLALTKEKLGDNMCLIGGFDQNEYLMNSTAAETKAAVKACFEQAGGRGGYIIAPSDHFFDAKDELIRAFVEAAHSMMYQ